jgi:hypothetical protein
MVSNGYVIGYLSGYRQTSARVDGYLHGYGLRKQAETDREQSKKHRPDIAARESDIQFLIIKDRP